MLRHQWGGVRVGGREGGDKWTTTAHRIYCVVEFKKTREIEREEYYMVDHLRPFRSMMLCYDGELAVGSCAEQR